MKVIHIASFKGNAGDIFNHNGFYELLSDVFDRKDVDKIEIRDFYFSSKQQRKFDKEFAEVVNTYDLCVLGGGSFFDCQWPNSATGTTMNITDEFLETVKIPVLVNAMGYHEFEGRTNDESIAEFDAFLNKIKSKDNWLVTIRNDGSRGRLERSYEPSTLSNIKYVVDNAFYNRQETVSARAEGMVGLCITNEAFCEGFNGVGFNRDYFNGMIAKYIDKLGERGKRVCLFAHTPQDIDVLGDIVGRLSEWTRRNSITVAPSNFVSDEREVTDLYLSWYSKCEYIVGMRFHSCVMGFLTGVPTVALAGHEQILGLYNELGMNEFALKADNSFMDNIDEVVERSMSRYSDIHKLAQDTILKNEEIIKRMLEDFLQRHGAIK